MIKFRAWDKVQNKMLLPDNIEFIHGQAYWAEASTDGNGGYSNDGKVDVIGALFDLEQFTGLTDVNGKDIYEGDIVHVVTGDGYRRTGKVVFEQEQGCYMVDNGWDKYPFNRFGYERDTLEVLGDVHENPELLEADND
ncbi:YopX family protein [Lactiplantibacillus argentoratensis]